MSALDQALTKAYAKTRSPAVANVTPMAVSDGRPSKVAPRATVASAVERIYHDGTLYRVESPSLANRTSSNGPQSGIVQQPHLKMLPPTSPRRTVRRSILRHLANHPAPTPIESQEAPAKVARKVIFRHISHSAAPPPLGLLRAGVAAGVAAPQEAEAELSPEIFSDEPAPTTSVPIPSSPTKPEIAKPETAPLNVAIENSLPIEILGDWNHDALLAPMMLIGNGERQESSWSVVSVSFDGLENLEKAALERQAEIAEQVAAEAVAVTAPEKSFAAKGLDDSEEPRVRFRLDAAHASASPAPHAKFAPVEIVEEAAAVVEEPTVAPSVIDEGLSLEPEAPVAEIGENEIGLTEIELGAIHAAEQEDAELTFAEAAFELLASDLIPPADADEAPEASGQQAAAEQTAASRTVSPLWEVDKFHWPRTCEKLMADDEGYLSRAGDKLLAAVQDGLRVLAITGTRRGEGRTTLALCLARAAAQAGVQVAVMDADFARPQLASKIALEVAFGWQDAALGRIPLSEAAVKSIHDRVTVLPLESAAVTRGLSLADPRVTATIRAASATFELLILDMGPMASSDSLTFPEGEGCPFDAAIVVRDLRFATATESQTVGEALHDAGVEAVGIAENFVIEDEIPATSV